MRRLFRYIRPLREGNDNQISLRSASALALIIDFIINVHNSASKVIRIIILQKDVNPNLVTAVAANLAQIGLILGVEAALIAALLGLKTYQNTVIGSIPPCGPVQPTEEGA